MVVSRSGTKRRISIQLISKTLRLPGWILTVITATAITHGHQMVNGLYSVVKEETV
jgi:hypothetical protein